MLHLALGLSALVASVPLLLLGAVRTGGARASGRQALRYLGRHGFSPPDSAETSSTTHAFAGLTRWLTPPAYASRVRERLARAGGRITVERFLALKGAGAVFGALLMLWTASRAPISGPVFGLLVGGAGFLLPDVILERRRSTRAEAIGRALPETLDLMAISVEAGVGLEGALDRAAQEVDGPLGEEYRRVLHEMNLGASRREAFQSLKQRVGVPAMTSFVLALLQADSLGIAVGRVLKTQAAEMRRRRRQNARERAAKTPVKILFPLILGIFPALLIVILGPAAIRIMGTLLVR
ncbi:MAG: type II secretion system F family protein [Actinomycetota bacterium]